MASLELCEYEKFSEETLRNNGFPNSKKTFEEFKTFALLNCDLNLLKLSINQHKEVLSAQNYVGTICLKSGDFIEIFPKICQNSNKNSKEESKKVLFEMLKTLKSFRSKQSESSNLEIEKLPLLECFIKMFIDEIFRIIKQGIKFGYEEKQENLYTFRGKLNFQENIRINVAHKERFFTKYDDFTANRPENKLIKSTLLYLIKISHNSKNLLDLKKLISMFDEIDCSLNYDSDFLKCEVTRNTQEYFLAISWCKTFLKGASFTSFYGANIATAVLFPMDSLFESYIAEKVKKEIFNHFPNYSVDIQPRGKYLFDDSKDFPIRPDIVIYNDKKDCFILDTKWKITGINFNDISTSDMYQMYVYMKKFNAKKVCLIYPKINDNQNEKKYIESNQEISTKYINLIEINDEIQRIFKILFES